MDKIYTFLLGLSLGLMVSYFAFGKFWLGILAGVPLGGILAALLVVGIAALADGNWWHGEDGGTGDGYRN